jgi:hypothetical protein
LNHCNHKRVIINIEQSEENDGQKEEQWLNIYNKITRIMITLMLVILIVIVLISIKLYVIIVTMNILCPIHCIHCVVILKIIFIIILYKRLLKIFLTFRLII